MKRTLFAALCLLLAIGFAGLGVWQVERRGWKLALIEQVDTRIRAAPVPLPKDDADALYRRVRATGRFDHRAETLVQAVTARGPGWWVMTPLDTGTATLIVNRGFVPGDRADPRTRAGGQVAGPVTVTGLIRLTEPGGGFLRANDPAAGRWYSRDVAAIAKARRTGAVLPYFVDADATPNPGGLPVGGMTVIAFSNNHLIYAITWFGLSALSLGGLALVVGRRGRAA